MKQTSATLDTGQYTRKEIEKYEVVYGRNFISPGGLATAREFTALLDLQPGMRVLDVGCGIGGGAFYMAQTYAVQVDGLDLSTNMLTIAQERCAALEIKPLLNFIHQDILEFDLQIHYDRIYSRDVFLHIADKARLFGKLKASLRPGGKLLFTDYCCGEGEKSPEFLAYIAQRQYTLCTVTEYANLLEQAGFVNVVAEDRSAQFINILAHESANLADAPLEQTTIAELRQSWQNKIRRAQRGEQAWGLFMASRSA